MASTPTTMSTPRGTAMPTRSPRPTPSADETAGEAAHLVFELAVGERAVARVNAGASGVRLDLSVEEDVDRRGAVAIEVRVVDGVEQRLLGAADERQVDRSRAGEADSGRQQRRQLLGHPRLRPLIAGVDWDVDMDATARPELDDDRGLGGHPAACGSRPTASRNSGPRRPSISRSATAMSRSWSKEVSGPTSSTATGGLVSGASWAIVARQSGVTTPNAADGVPVTRVSHSPTAAMTVASSAPAASNVRMARSVPATGELSG